MTGAARTRPSEAPAISIRRLTRKALLPCHHFDSSRPIVGQSYSCIHSLARQSSHLPRQQGRVRVRSWAVISVDFLNADEAERAAFDWPDVYFSPGYGRAAATMEDGTWELAVGNRGEFLYPYVKRPIPGSSDGMPQYDIASPYGYAGVWAVERA